MRNLFSPNETGLKPNFWEALNNQGIVLFELGKKKDSIRSWRKVLTISKNAEPMLALATALNEINPESKEVLKLAKEALLKNPNYVSPNHQKEQLWGSKLREAAKKLLTKPELVSAVERAEANSD